MNSLANKDDRWLYSANELPSDPPSIVQHNWPDYVLDSAEDASQPLRRKVIFSYGVGHMLNDLTAASWFTYLLIFLTGIGLSPSEAATVMLSGQLADGIATIFVGNLIDSHGHYKLWHAAGSLLVAISFSSVFGDCWACAILGRKSRLATTIVYSVFAAIFNIGWAAAQVSHMALVNCLSSNATSRVGLTSSRNAFTMVANLCLYAIAYAIFGAFPAKDPGDIEKQYRSIARVSVLLGWIFVLIFFAGVKEPRLEHLLKAADSPRISWWTWFHKKLYYQVAFVYVITRLTTNVSQAFLAFYVINDLGMRDSAKALVPAAIFVCSFIVSIALQEMTGWSGRRIKYFFSLGAIMWIVSGIFIFLLSRSTQNLVFVLAVMVGAANALMTVTAVSMEGILVGIDISGCAFVYGSLSFLDKLICGVALFAIEALNVNDEGCRPQALGGAYECSMSTVRLTLALVPGGCALMGACVTCLMDLQTSSVTDIGKPLLLQGEVVNSKYSWKDSPSDLNVGGHGSIWRKLASTCIVGNRKRDHSATLH